jgi:hypothetical protein
MKVLPVPPLSVCIKALGPTDNWKGDCYGIASRLVDKGLVKGVAVYGHWLGPIAETSYFGPKRGMPFCQHGWVLMPDKTIVDPTRWVFEDVEPYIYHGENDFYDEGGNEFRMALLGPPPKYDPTERQYEITKSIMRTVTWNFVEKVLKIDITEQEPGFLTLSQLHWLAKLSPERLGEHQAGVYRALVKLDRKALIPIDNFMTCERKLGRKKRETGDL